MTLPGQLDRCYHPDEYMGSSSSKGVFVTQVKSFRERNASSPVIVLVHDATERMQTAETRPSSKAHL